MFRKSWSRERPEEKMINKLFIQLIINEMNYVFKGNMYAEDGEFYFRFDKNHHVITKPPKHRDHKLDGQTDSAIHGMDGLGRSIYTFYCSCKKYWTVETLD